MFFLLTQQRHYAGIARDGREGLSHGGIWSGSDLEPGEFVHLKSKQEVSNIIKNTRDMDYTYINIIMTSTDIQ